MFTRIKLILAYAEWLSLVICCAVFGWSIQSRSLIGGIVIYLVSALLLWIIFDLSSKKLSTATRITGDNYIGNPIMDIFMIILCFQAYIEDQEWAPLAIAGSFVVGIDLIRWGLSLKQNKITT